MKAQAGVRAQELTSREQGPVYDYCAPFPRLCRFTRWAAHLAGRFILPSACCKLSGLSLSH